jgi:VanZ family protein
LARRAFLFAVISSSLYGLSDELHQAFVPMRESSWLDEAANMIGSALGGGVVGVLSRGHGRTSSPSRAIGRVRDNP